MIRRCAACHYPNDTRFALCAWCWETLLAGHALASRFGEHVNVGETDREMAVLAAGFVVRAHGGQP